MSDLIKRADAIDAVAKDIADVLNVSKDETRELAEHALSALPSAEAVQGWIPCSERLPSQTGEYLATVDFHGAFFTDKFAYEPTANGGWHDPELPDQTFVEWGEFIIAWMPLPTPYKGGDNE